MKKIIFLFIILCFGCQNSKLNEDKTIVQSNNVIEITYERENILALLKIPGEKTLNIDNLFEIKIPDNLEIVSLNQYLHIDINNTQYCISNVLETIYQNRHFSFIIECFGETNTSILNGHIDYNLNKIINNHAYRGRNQINYLKENYTEHPVFNKNNVKLSKFISTWSTSWSSDYYGLFFTLSDKEFNECVISIYNIWGTFTKKELRDINEENYKQQIQEEGGDLENIFNILELMENSISLNISENSIKINKGNVSAQIIEDTSIFPAINNLRMRKNPSLNSEITGYMKNIIYRVIVIGDEAEIDGIKGNWIMVVPYNGNTASWVFNGYTRKASNDELDNFYGG